MLPKNPKHVFYYGFDYIANFFLELIVFLDHIYYVTLFEFFGQYADNPIFNVSHDHLSFPNFSSIELASSHSVFQLV